MPHKHTRRGIIDKSAIDLPPTHIAKPLPVSKSAAANGIFTSAREHPKKTKKRKRNKDNEDDTPKAFLRLMALQQGKKLPKGLDDGVKKAKTKKTNNETVQALVAAPHSTIPEVTTLKIHPGERMSEFGARVDAALPIGGLINKSTRGAKDPLGLKVGRTKTEKRMHKMYDEWRVADAKRKEALQEAAELAEEEEMDDDGQMKWKVDISTLSKKGKKRKKKRVVGEVNDGDDDPWAKIARDRNETKAGLHDVVQAPPTFTRIPTEKFKVHGAVVNVGDVPKNSGSLRRREELGEIRKSVIEQYRAKIQVGA